MVRVFSFRGHSEEELKKMSISEFAKLLTARERRTLLKRGMTEQQKRFLERIRKNPQKFHKTHLRDMIILPDMIGVKFGVHIGGGPKGSSVKWFTIVVKADMVGKRLGDFAVPIKHVKHSIPGMGATRGSKFISAK